LLPDFVQIQYRLKDFKFLQNIVKLLVTHAHGTYIRHEWRPFDKQINNMLSKEDRILIKGIRVEKGFGAEK